MDKYEKAFEELQDHFLGKGFYIADPVSGEQAVKIITDTIKSTYPGAGESPVDKWRRKHKKCKWCIYHKLVRPLLYVVPYIVNAPLRIRLWMKIFHDRFVVCLLWRRRSK